MSRQALVLDTEILVVVIVGSIDKTLLGKTPHLKAYAPDDYELLDGFLEKFKIIAVTPHVLTEVSHFISKLEGNHRKEARRRLAALSTLLRERPVSTKHASQREEYQWLDLADCTLLVAAGPNDTVLTMDSQLCARRQQLHLPAINFNHVRDVGWNATR